VGRKILALVAEPVSGEALRSALGDEADDAEVMVVAPALDSRTRFWTSDNDDAIARAEDVQEETVERLAEEGVDAVGDTGETDPLLALQDALATFPAEEILIVTHPEGEQNWAEADLVEEAEDRFDMPVRQMQVDGS
jgi:kynurenine formamidase